MARLSSHVLLRFLSLVAGPTTPELKTLVWALPISLAATLGISFDFFSSAYLDVSVRQVSPPAPMYSVQDSGELLPLGCPIRISSGSMLFSSSPELFAGCRVLLRLSMPRHPPAALTSLTK